MTLTLQAATAGGMMTPSPVVIPDHASIREAAATLTQHGISGAPVTTPERRIVGVISRTDIVRYEREHRTDLSSGAALELWLEEQARRERHGDRSVGGPEAIEHALFEDIDSTMVCEIMTPTVYTARLDTPAEEVVEQLLARDVGRLFVLDAEGVLVGVVSTADVLAHLSP